MLADVLAPWYTAYKNTELTKSKEQLLWGRLMERLSKWSTDRATTRETLAPRTAYRHGILSSLLGREGTGRDSVVPYRLGLTLFRKADPLPPSYACFPPSPEFQIPGRYNFLFSNWSAERTNTLVIVYCTPYHNLYLYYLNTRMPSVNDLCYVSLFNSVQAK